jgi:hypothetical protein
MLKVKRTQAEIDRQIEGLTKMKDHLPEYSMFGDANWEKIDAQIAVLKGEAEPNDYYINEDGEDYEDGDNDVWSEAERASQWLDGEENDDLFE